MKDEQTVIKKLFGGLYLGSLLFGLVTWVMLPFLLYEVRDARVNGQVVDVTIVASYMHYRGRNCSLRLTFTLPDEKEVTIGDPIPGDISTCGRNALVAGDYVVGKRYQFIAVGDKYYVSHGEYWWSILIATIGLIPYLYLMYSIKKSKHSVRADSNV